MHLRAVNAAVLINLLLISLRAPAQDITPRYKLEVGEELQYRHTLESGFDKLLPHIPVVPPEESLKRFRVEPGFRVELVASEPNVCDPVDIAFDEAGRMYVCELWNYPGVPRPGEKLGRIRLLTSSKNDGFYDRSTVFADNLRWPSSIIFWDGGVYIISNPDIWYLKDATGNGTADVKKKVFTGLRGQTYEVGNSLRWGPDNRIYVCGSYAGGELRPAGSTEPGQRSRDFRFDPRTNTCEPVSGSGEWGATFNDWGDQFTCDATHFVHHPVLPRDELARNPYLAVPAVQEDSISEWERVFPISKPEPWKSVRQQFWQKWVNTNSDMNAGRFPQTELAPQGYATSASGLTVYRGSAFPPAYRGNAFIGEPANNIVARLELREQDGPSIVATHIVGAQPHEFLASTDNRFRPVNFANGPDGCLYVVSMYREIIEDETAIPDDILKHYDLYSGRDLGRIYRVLPEGFRRPTLPNFASATTGELVALLGNGDSWIRQTAQRLLYQKQDAAAVEPLRKLVADGAIPQARIHALWTLRGLAALDEPSVLHGLNDADLHVREQALVLSRGSIAASSAIRGKVLSLAGDASGRVRFQVALALVGVEGDDTMATLARLAHRDSGDRWTRTAIAAATPTQSGALATTLLSDPQFLANSHGAWELIGMLAQSTGARHDTTEVARLMGAMAGPELDAHAEERITLVRQLAEGLARGGSSLPEQLANSGTGDLRKAMSSLFASAARTAADSAAGMPHRVEAVQLLAFAPLAEVSATLDNLLNSPQPPAVQVAAVRALSAHADPVVGKTLLARWKTLGPSVRPDVIEALFRRPERLPALLDAIENKRFPAGELQPSRRNALLKNGDSAIRSRAATLLSAPESGDKQPLIDRYKAEVMKLKGDAARGMVVFHYNCAICHKPDQGQPPGPNLATLEDRSPGTLIVAILDPNREVKPSFVNYLLTTKDGQDYSGAVVNETATSVTIRHAGGGEDTVLRANIASLRSTGLSLMPDGLEGAVNYQQMADLLQFLQTMGKN